MYERKIRGRVDTDCKQRNITGIEVTGEWIFHCSEGWLSSLSISSSINWRRNQHSLLSWAHCGLFSIDSQRNQWEWKKGYRIWKKAGEESKTSCVKVPKEKAPEPIGWRRPRRQCIPKTAIFQVLSSMGSVSSRFLCQRAIKMKQTPQAHCCWAAVTWM